MPETSSQRTPPDIVQASDEPEVALTAFIAQDLESWGFQVGDTSSMSEFCVFAGNQTLRVEVWKEL